MGEGSWTIRLKLEAPPSLYNTLTKHGHIVVTPQPIDPRQFGDAATLAAARYAGPLLSRKYDSGQIVLRGAGMVWWLGSQGRGAIYESPVSLSSASLSSALTSLLPSAVTSGTVTNGSLPTYTGEFVAVTPLDAIRTLMVGMGAAFRINPDGTMDAGDADTDDVFTVTSPVVVVVRKNWGTDPTYKAVFPRSASAETDAAKYVTRAIMIQETSSGTKSITDSTTRASDTYDIHGNAFTRTVAESGTADASASTATYLASVLDAHDEVDTQKIDADQWEVTGGGWQPGDMFYVYDPPGLVDTANQIFFRGDVIHPKKLRLIEAAWPVRFGMGVYYRPATASPSGTDWTDLSELVDWEEGGARINEVSI